MRFRDVKDSVRDSDGVSGFVCCCLGGGAGDIVLVFMN